jgi:hypothetical protein
VSERPDETAEQVESQDPASTDAEPATSAPDAAALPGEPLDDPEDQHVVFMSSEDEGEEVVGPRFQTQKLDPAERPDGELADAYDCLSIRTPLEEFQTYARARLETLVKLGEAERAQLASEALEAGLGALRHVMGGSPEEASQ